MTLACTRLTKIIGIKIISRNWNSWAPMQWGWGQRPRPAGICSPLCRAWSWRAPEPLPPASEPLTQQGQVQQGQGSLEEFSTPPSPSYQAFWPSWSKAPLPRLSVTMMVLPKLTGAQHPWLNTLISWTQKKSLLLQKKIKDHEEDRRDEVEAKCKYRVARGSCKVECARRSQHIKQAYKLPAHFLLLWQNTWSHVI